MYVLTYPTYLIMKYSAAAVWLHINSINNNNNNNNNNTERAVVAVTLWTFIYEALSSNFNWDNAHPLGSLSL
jgi:hypothetical protein